MDETAHSNVNAILEIQCHVTHFPGIVAVSPDGRAILVRKVSGCFCFKISFFLNIANNGWEK